jgi:hypothetical protein
VLGHMSDVDDNVVIAIHRHCAFSNG